MKNKNEKMFSGYRDLKVYPLAFKTAMEIYKETRKFPKNEYFY